MMSDAKPIQMPYGAYHKTTFPGYDPELTEVQPDSPMGEYMRKFWHPVCLSEELTDVPKAIRILGEDLVAFRDRSGQVGVLQRHCSHRGTSLEYGIIQPKGIRCCYHGWVYDIDGTILEMPAEPKDSKIYDTVVHGAYPAFERSGLIFAYMGDPEQKPDFPEYDSFTQPAGTKLVAFSNIYPCNFLQAFENVADHFHTAILHNGMTVDSLDEATKKSITLGGFVGLPTVHWEAARDGNGIMFVSCRRNPDNQTFWVRSIELSFPNFIQFGGLYASARQQRHATVALSRWHVPVDNHNVILFGWRHFNQEVDPDGEGDESRCGYDSIDFLEGQTGGRSYADGQRAPGDWEALSSQRSIAVHALENPGYSDTGVYMLRKLLREAVRGNTPADSTREVAQGGKDTLHVYTQDTVINVPKSPDGDDGELMLSYGLKVLEILKEVNNIPGAHRDGHVRARLDELDGGLLEAAE